MKILIVSHYFWPENLRVNDLAVELKARGHDITVLTGWPNYPEGRLFLEFRRSPRKFREYKGIRVMRMPVIPRRNGRAAWLSLNYLSFIATACLFGPLALLGRRFDAIVVFGASPITSCIPAIWLGFLKKAPVAFWVLDLWPESLKAVGAVRSERILNGFGRVVRWIYNHCTVILAQSKSFMTAIPQYCDYPEKLRYFPSWSEELFGGIAAAPAPEVPRAEGVFTVLFAGNIGDAQGFPNVLDAAEKLCHRKDIRWIIVGDGRMAGWLRENVAAHGLQDQLLLPGRFPLERMPSFFAHADALLVTLKESDIFSMTIPGKLQTYLSSGIPVLGAIDGESAEVIRESGAGFACKAGDADALAEIVCRMADLSPEERARMGDAGKRYYAEQFDKTSLFNKLDQYLIEMLGRKAKEA